MRDNWIETTLGEMVDIQKGKKPPVLGDNTSPGEPYLTADVLRGGAPSQFVPPSALAACVQLQGDETILLWDGAGAGDVFRSSVGVLASTMAKLTTKPTNTILAEYLYLVAMNASTDIKSSCRGTTVPHVSPGALTALALTLPPLSEQKRIVDVLASVDTYIAALQRQAANARAARKAVLHELLDAGGDRWADATLGEVAEIQQGQNLAISTLTTGEHPVYGANGIVGHFDRWNFNQDVVALGCRGSCGTVHSVTGKVWLANNVMAVWPKNESQVAVAFIALVLETADLRSSGVISGQVQPQITRTSLSTLGLTLPPLSEQEEIVGIVSAMDNVIGAAQEAVSSARELRSGLLSDLLSGDHEIPATYDRLLGAA